MEDSQRIANEAAKYKYRKNKIDKGITVNEQTVRARSGKNLDDNIESAQRNTFNTFHKSYYDSLNPEETKFLTENDINPESKNDQDIGNAIDGRNASPLAKKIAESHFKLTNDSNLALVESGALPSYGLNKERQLHATHDRKKMMYPNQNLWEIIKNKRKYNPENAKELWKNKIKKEVNLKKTYIKIGAIDEEGNLDMSKVEKSMDRTWDNIVNGRMEHFTKSDVLNDEEALKKKQHMFFVWNDTSSWLRYNKIYGTGSYHSAVQAHIRSTSNKVGTANILGSNPSRMWQRLRKYEQQANPQKKLAESAAEKNFKYITGMDKTAVDPTVAAIGSNLRALTGMSRLGTIALMSISDITKGASHVSKFGPGSGIHTFWATALHNVTHIFNNPLIDSDERKYIAEIFKLNLDSHMGYQGKWGDANEASNVISKFTNGFYKYTGMHALDNGNKIGTMTMTARTLADRSKEEYNNLNKELKFQLNKYNISPEEWNLLRTKNDTEYNLFTTDNVERLTKDELKSLQVGDNANKTLAQIKNDLMRKVYTIFDVANNVAIGQPDAYMKAFLDVGKKGTPGGELLKSLIQFKAFPLQHIDRMYINNYKELDGAKAKAIFFGNMFIAGAGMNYLSDHLQYLSRGQTPPDISLMSGPEKVKYYANIMDSNIGLFWKLANNSYGGKYRALNLLSSPTTEFVGNLLGAVSDAGMGLTGDKKEIKSAIKNAKNAAKGIMPISTIPFISPLVNEMIDQKTYAEPGQEQLYGQ
jgi:hypothetical protein